MNIRLLSLVLFICFPVSSLAQNASARFLESDKSPVSIPDDLEYVFGYMEVPENRSVENSNTIQVPVYRFKSTSSEPKGDPVLILVGGPGSTIVPNAPYMKYYSYLADRDIILMEQRGNYFAKPHLDCPELPIVNSQLALKPDLSKEERQSQVSQAVSECANRHRSNGVDLNGYNTKEIAKDVEDLRKVLGVEQWNLVTLSYGTKIAQQVIRDYPETVRSAVLDSPLPLERFYDEEANTNLLNAYSKLFELCANDKMCKENYPDLENRFKDFLIDSYQTPIPVSFRAQNNSETTTFDLTGRDIINIGNIGSTNNIPSYPFLMNTVLSGDTSLLSESLLNNASSNDGNGLGMRLAVWCSEETPWVDTKIVLDQINKHPEIAGRSPMVFEKETCKAFGVEPKSKNEKVALESNVPILLINGSIDPDTPSEWGISMLDNLPNAHHLIFEGWGHTPIFNWNNKCAMNMSNQFINEPGTKPVDECIEEIKITFE